MHISFDGTLEELVRFAERLGRREDGPEPSPVQTEEPKSTKTVTKKVDKLTEKVVEKPVEKVVDKPAEKSVEKAADPIPASTETPMPPASNGALAVLKNAMAALITAKGRDEVTKLLTKYGVEKVSQVKEADAATMTEEARALAK